MSNGGSINHPRGWEALGKLAATLRSPNGCPWDRAQTVRTLLPYLVEEAHEALHDAESNDEAHLAQELGDVCFVLSLTLQAMEDEGWASFEEIARRTVAKIERRHPHVFAGESAGSPEEVARRWEEIKRAEHRADGSLEEGAAPGSLAPGAPALPALWQAVKLQAKVAAVGFDWTSAEQIVEKIREELDEVEEACATLHRDHVREEVGDLLFAVTNLARRLEVDPETALREANRKFRRRWNRMMEIAASRGQRPEELGLSRLDDLWNEVKAESREDKGKGG